MSTIKRLVLFTAEPSNFVPVELKKAADALGLECCILDVTRSFLVESLTDGKLTSRLYSLEAERPGYAEPESTFESNGRVYDLNRLFTSTASAAVQAFPVADLSWVLEHTRVDPARAAAADLKVPILVTQEDERWVVVDGAHRLSRAVTEGSTLINAKVVPPELMAEALLDAKKKVGAPELKSVVRPIELDAETCVIPRLNEYHLDVKLGMLKRIEAAGAVMLNDADSMQLCNDKLASQVVLNTAGIKTPLTCTVTSLEDLEQVIKFIEEERGLKYPTVLKTLHGTQGVGVMKVDSHASLISVAQLLIKEAVEFTVQEFIPHESSLRVIMLGDGVLAANVRGQPKNKDEFRTNAHLGSETTPYEPKEDEVALGRKIVKLFGCRFCAVDYLVLEQDGKRELVVFEVNGSPGLEGMQSDWPDRNLAEEVVRYVMSDKASAGATEPGKPKQEFSSTQVVLPKNVADQLAAAAKRLIAPEDVDAEHGLEDRPHITVKYGLHSPDVEAVRRVVAGSIKATVAGVEVFEPEGKGYDVVVVRVDSPDLVKLNKAIADAVPHTDTHPEYKPHVTLGYVKRDLGKKYSEIKTGLEGQVLTFDVLEVSDQDEQVTQISLTGEHAQAGLTTENALHEVEPITIHRIIDEPIEGRVDTGAKTSSLHASQVAFDRAFARFKRGDVVYKVPVSRVVKVKNVHAAGEHTRRPVVLFDVTVHGQRFDDVEFTLTDRTNMRYEVLIGRNVLELLGLPVLIPKTGDGVAHDVAPGDEVEEE